MFTRPFDQVLCTRENRYLIQAIYRAQSLLEGILTNI